MKKQVSIEDGFILNVFKIRASMFGSVILFRSFMKGMDLSKMWYLLIVMEHACIRIYTLKVGTLSKE